jgi:hypothetical protein
VLMRCGSACFDDLLLPQLKQQRGVCSFAIMNPMGTIFLLAVGLATLDANALEVRQSPYDKIVERNLFQLHGPPMVFTDATPKPSLLRKATLTGIATILERPVAFITIEGTKSQPADWVMLANGQRVNGIEVKGIDERAGVVRILNESELQILNFEPAKASGMQSDSSLMLHPRPSPPVPAQPEAAMTPEEQTALIELQRIKFQQEGDPIEAILPPTQLSTNDNGSTTP